MREEWSRDRRGSASEQQYDLAFEIETSEIIVLGFWHLQPITGEHQRRLDVRRGIDAHAERRLVAEDDGHDRRPAHDREA